MEIDNLSDIFGDLEFNEDNEFFMDDQGDKAVDYEEETTTESLDELTSHYFPSDESLTIESYVIEHHKSLNGKRRGLPNHENEVFSKEPSSISSFEDYVNKKNQDKNEMLGILSSNKTLKSFDKLIHSPRKLKPFKPIIFDLDPENVHNEKTKGDMSRVGKDPMLPKLKPIVFDLPQETLQNGETTEIDDGLMSHVSFESQKLQSSKRRKNNSSVMSRLTFLNGSDVMSRVSFIGTGDVMSRVSYVGKDTELSNNDVIARVSFSNQDSESSLSNINGVASRLNFLNISKEKCNKISTKAAKNHSILWATQVDSYIDDLYNEDENSDGEVDRLSITLQLQKLTIGNFISHYPCAISLNPTTQSICFTNLMANTSTTGDTSDTSRLDIHIKGFEHYSRNDKLIELLLASKISKWLIPVRTIINDNEIHLSIDPSEGEITKAGKISMIVSDQEDSDKLRMMDDTFRTFVIENEENWEECKKMVAKERHENESIIGNEAILELFK
ncbi:31421_t:CDS:2 [Gigaspora margarita]|uniref:31421_t:CDS:1 n=1 Tax=Gigaspora margarita TaxID=4874 RepID=A0ABM8VWJ1_GIGMA|nr:31421_t:CDS:2 [Gigaspora margarita]